MNDYFEPMLQWAEDYLKGCMDKSSESKSDWDRLIFQANVYSICCAGTGLIIALSLYGSPASSYALVFVAFSMLCIWHRRSVIRDQKYWESKWQLSIDWAINYRDEIKKHMKGY